VQLRELVVQDLRDRSAQRGLAVVDVTDGADVDVRLGPLELGLRHHVVLLGLLLVVLLGRDRRPPGRVGRPRAAGAEAGEGPYPRPPSPLPPRVFAMISSAMLEGTSA